MLGLGMLSVSDVGSLTGFRKVGRISSYDVGLMALHLIDKTPQIFRLYIQTLYKQEITINVIRGKICVLTSVSEQGQYCCNV